MSLDQMCVDKFFLKPFPRNMASIKMVSSLGPKNMSKDVCSIPGSTQ